MPDWSYQTLFRPLLFRLNPRTARGLALGSMGLLARLPGGGLFIDFLGHMRPDPRLARDVMGTTFPTAVGLGVGIDEPMLATRALAHFGFGFLEVGALGTRADSEKRPDKPTAEIELDATRETITLHGGLATWSAEAMAARLARLGDLGIPLLVRLPVFDGGASAATAACQSVIAHLAPHVRLFCAAAPHRRSDAGTTVEWHSHLAQAVAIVHASSPAHRLLVGVPADARDGELDALVGPAVAAGIDGLLIEGFTRSAEHTVELGSTAYQATLHTIRQVRARWGPELAIIAGGGIHEPRQALDTLEAGADLTQLDSGLVFAGPGLPKRVNEAILSRQTTCPQPNNRMAPASGPSPRPAQQSWFWLLLIALGMLGGGALALVIAATRVVMPYDEALVDMTRAQIAAVNDHLLAFMTHDRVTLAGTMLALGILYGGLALFGARRGADWAHWAVVASALVGFASFFGFLGFGYFDPLHAFVTAVLFQLLLMAIHAGPSPPVAAGLPCLDNDWRWRCSLWGQLLYVVHGGVLIVAGGTISVVGMTTVFVAEDLDFMQTTAAALHDANPRLLPLIAHDRATFGGMLIACGTAVLLTSLWGIRRGHAWLWWSLTAAGIVAYAATIAVHWSVGYTHHGHLVPAYAGLAGVLGGAVLLYPYLAANLDRRSAEALLRV